MSYMLCSVLADADLELLVGRWLDARDLQKDPRRPCWRLVTPIYLGLANLVLFFAHKKSYWWIDSSWPTDTFGKTSGLIMRSSPAVASWIHRTHRLAAAEAVVATATTEEVVDISIWVRHLH